MIFLDLAKERYTTKEYNPDKKITDEKIQQLKDILRLSPSSINSQPWKFFFISDQETKDSLAKVSYFNEGRIKNASHLIVFTVVDDISFFENHNLSSLAEGSVMYYNQFMKPKGETVIKSWLRQQVYLSLGFFLSACASLGIDSTPMEGIQAEEYDRILDLDTHKTLFAVAIGYKNPDDSNQPAINPKSRLPLEQIIESI
ncbi:NAD(P)H-dependent oxidoreductase [Dysgonomonas sp. HDW5A]|uniref:NAD(P)H-dependent oxidoreductase n=1 Tax=Dysgonomonas sp. HDW5A TaxID=2714926 RepID=UPI001407C5CB|nr:NAD(P)H-dependent oxidoreductase [Dysgonomonas sp. HDW5A]QIK60106.1 NAD(P)H-dependent oxidoreductase [Dysgonomonas sp. HDW5A]